MRVVDKLPQFARKAHNALDDALQEAAKDTLIAAKTRAPFDKGGLRSETDVKKVEKLLWRVSFWKEYARFQEFGGDGKRTVRNYSAAGTGKFYLKRSGDEQTKKLVSKFKKHSVRVKV